MILSIIIPYYNAKEYTDELLDCLDKQVTSDVQVLLIDDGSKVPYKTEYEWCKVIRQQNGGAASARNKGLDMADGDYVAFIDADDMVSDKYIKTIFDTIDREKPDYIYLSWKTLAGGWECDVKLTNVSDKFPSFNLCVWNRIYKRSKIGKVRFNEKKLIAEDAEFIRKVKETGKKAIISDYMYFYRSDTPNSLTKRFSAGNLDTQRIVYHYKHITEDMTDLIKEVRQADKRGEVIIMTEQNDLPELSKYAMVTEPIAIKGTEFHGEPTNLFTRINRPIKTQVVMWTARTEKIGGIETFIYNFCVQLHDLYDIMVLYDTIDKAQLNRLRKVVEVRKNDIKVAIDCDTLIVNRITDKTPANVTFKKKIQMCHTCKIVDSWEIPTDCDDLVFVSETAMKSWGFGGATVINNMTRPWDMGVPLILISATRISTFEKGTERMITFAKMLNEAHIDYLWLCFTDYEIKPQIPNMVHVSPVLDIRGYLAMADYLVQLSDSEAFGYSIVEALEVGTPVITTPIDVLSEIGFKDGIHGHIVPFDMKDIDLSMFNKKLEFAYTYNNEKRIKQWRKILGNTKPTHRYNPDELKYVRIITDYYDIELQQELTAGTEIQMTAERAQTVRDAGYCEVVE